MFVQGVLTLQPTVTKADKSRGLALHQVFQIAGLAISMRYCLLPRLRTTESDEWLFFP
jgi:hypothetical protein